MHGYGHPCVSSEGGQASGVGSLGKVMAHLDSTFGDLELSVSAGSDSERITFMKWCLQTLTKCKNLWLHGTGWNLQRHRSHRRALMLELTSWRRVQIQMPKPGLLVLACHSSAMGPGERCRKLHKYTAGPLRGSGALFVEGWAVSVSFGFPKS